jgi:hypothetical protein
LQVTKKLTLKIINRYRYRFSRFSSATWRLVTIFTGLAGSACAAWWLVAVAAKMEGDLHKTWKEVNLALWIAMGLVACFGCCALPVKRILAGFTIVSVDAGSRWLSDGLKRNSSPSLTLRP